MPVYPFQLKQAFVIKSVFERAATIPDPLELKFHSSIRIEEEHYPKEFTIFLRTLTEDIPDPSLKVFVELVGIFSLVEGNNEPDKSIIDDFLNQQALFMMWPYFAECVLIATTQMGMQPIRLNTPYTFNFKRPIAQQNDASEGNTE